MEALIKTVGGLKYPNSNRKPMGRVYLPPEYVGKKVSITIIDEIEEEDTKTEETI